MDHLDSYSRMGFNFEGQFLGFVRHDGALKYLRLSVLSEEMLIKLPKAMRLAGGLSLQPGDLLRVIGTGKMNRHALKLKATQITLLTDRCPELEPASGSTTPPSPESSESHAAISKPKAKAKLKVLICQKSGCLKHGGKGLFAALENALYDRNLQHQVTIERTGCLKCCSSAPNLTIMPGNHRYKDVCLKTLPQIVDAIGQQLATR